MVLMPPRDERNPRERTRSRSDRHRLVRRHPRRDAVAHRAGEEAAHLRNPARPAGGSQGADQAATATLDYQDIVRNDDIKVVYISTTPEANAFSDRARLPEGRQARAAGKADRARAVGGRRADRAREARQPQIHHRLFAALQHQDRLRQEEDHRRHARQAGLGDGEPAHQSRSLGKKIASRVRLSPAAMESTHDLDFVFWLLEPAKPVRVYSQGAYGYMQPVNGSYDIMWSTVTMDNGVAGRDRRRLEPAAELSELLRHLDRDHRHRRLAVPRRHPARQLAQHREGRHAVSDVDHAGRAGRSRLRRADGTGDHPLPRIRACSTARRWCRRKARAA